MITARRIGLLVLLLAIEGCATHPPAQDVRIVRNEDDVTGCRYIKTVSTAEEPYLEGRTVFDRLRTRARREGGDTVQLQFVVGSDQSVGPTNAITAKLYRCAWPPPSGETR